MQISTELIHGVKMAASMAQNLMGDANKLIAKEDAAAQRHQLQEMKTAMETAVAREQRHGITKALLALIDCGIAYEEMVSLLMKYWDISDSAAREHVTRVQTVDFPIKALGYYLQSQGWTEEEIVQYLKDNAVRRKLRLDHDLWKLTPQKLAAHVEEE